MTRRPKWREHESQVSNVKKWTPEELEAFRDELCQALDQLADSLRRIRFLLEEE